MLIANVVRLFLNFSQMRTYTYTYQEQSEKYRACTISNIVAYSKKVTLMRRRMLTFKFSQKKRGTEQQENARDAQLCLSAQCFFSQML
jgi:hypothetical protein